MRQVADLQAVSAYDSVGRPGGFARDRFVDRRRQWRRRFWWAFPLVLIVPVAIELPIALITKTHSGFSIGIGIGAGVGAAFVFFDSPPAHIENWRSGAEGERSTAKRLRPLLRQGWSLFNDIETLHGNIDHVLVGPGGVFMLESKRLSGRVTVEAGKLAVRWHEDLEDGYENHTIGNRARGAAFDLHSRLLSVGLTTFVQPVVVLWADFPQRSVERDKVGWVQGEHLAEVLSQRPKRHSSEQVEQIVALTALALERLRAEHQAKTAVSE